MDIKPIHIRASEPKYQNKHDLAPQFPYRLCIVGASGSGKTFHMLGLLPHLHYDTLTVLARHIDNPQYSTLRSICEDIEEAASKESGGQETKFSFFSDNLEDAPEVDSFNPQNQNLVIIDDFAGLPDNKLRYVVDMFIRGRHKGCSPCYLTQSYHRLPKTARLSCSYIVLFRGLNFDDKKAVYKDHLGDMTFDEFDHLYHACTDGQYGYMVLDLVNPKLGIRRTWDEIYVRPKNNSLSSNIKTHKLIPHLAKKVKHSSSSESEEDDHDTRATSEESEP